MEKKILNMGSPRTSEKNKVKLDRLGLLKEKLFKKLESTNKITGGDGLGIGFNIADILECIGPDQKKISEFVKELFTFNLIKESANEIMNSISMAVNGELSQMSGHEVRKIQTLQSYFSEAFNAQ
ncbi:MAG: hypothetical protein KKA19_07520, partial [Candidatus Margulisbacteria bacterium]|nr:hypothetical protein [Candidatus Margulisiibacteriota bacterium]